MSAICQDHVENNSFIRTAWQMGSRNHGKIFHILNQVLLFIEIADRIWKMI